MGSITGGGSDVYHYHIICILECKITSRLLTWTTLSAMYDDQLQETTVLEKLTVAQLVQFPEFYRIRSFISMFITARHLTLFSATYIQCTPSQSLCVRYIFILSSHLLLKNTMNSWVSESCYHNASYVWVCNAR
jgi:hypothetical protein